MAGSLAKPFAAMAAPLSASRHLRVGARQRRSRPRRLQRALCQPGRTTRCVVVLLRPARHRQERVRPPTGGRHGDGAAAQARLRPALQVDRRDRAKLARAFEEARQDNCFLIIDEAEGFLWSRAGASRSWEVPMVNELLVQMESHPCPSPAPPTTWTASIPAALRRFAFKVKFDFMTLGAGRSGLSPVLRGRAAGVARRAAQPHAWRLCRGRKEAALIAGRRRKERVRTSCACWNRRSPPRTCGR